MQHTFLPDGTIQLDATLDELTTWQHTGLAVYATPAHDDPTYAVQVYVGSRPQGPDDWCLATPCDFLDAALRLSGCRRQGSAG